VQAFEQIVRDDPFQRFLRKFQTLTERALSFGESGEEFYLPYL
jgi:hypothetical protein